jgi:XTP/dITP diphosphohydrolase
MAMMRRRGIMVPRTIIPPAPPRVVLATGNPGKIIEFEDLLAPLGWELTSAKDLDLSLPTEPTRLDGATLTGNATLKAEFIAKATGGWALADDSGLFVAALPNDLGVDTALYGGVPKLLQALEGVRNRRATFQCVLALAHPGRSTQLFSGEDTGTIAQQAIGTAGLTYDPVFIQDNHTQTNSARMEALGVGAVKGLGHRGKAVQALIAWAKQESDTF